MLGPSPDREKADKLISKQLKKIKDSDDTASHLVDITLPKIFWEIIAPMPQSMKEYMFSAIIEEELKLTFDIALELKNERRVAENDNDGNAARSTSKKRRRPRTK